VVALEGALVEGPVNMKLFSTLLMLVAVLLSPRLSRAEEQHPTSIRSAADAPRDDARVPAPRLWSPSMSVGAAQLKLDVAASRWGITMSLAL
jgi:hypothetical protein